MGENTYIDVVEYINCGGNTHNSLTEESSCQLRSTKVRSRLK